MLSIIEADGDTFAQRAEMFYKSRPELIRLLYDAHKSYRTLAERYDQLRSEFNPSVNPIRSLSAMSFESLSEVQSIYPNNNDNNKQTSSSSLGDHHHLKPKDSESTRVESANQRFQGRDQGEKDQNELQVGNSSNNDMFEDQEPKRWNKIGNETRELLEELVQQQAELIRRNEEKTEAIRDLHSQINRLKDENGFLKTCLTNIHDQVDTTSTKRNNHRSPISKFKGPFFSKFTGCTGSK